MYAQKGKVIDDKIISRSLEEEVDLLVYLPPNYSPLYTYNILIAQDGRDYFNLGRIARAADALYQSNQIEQTIIIGVPHLGVEDRKQKYHPNGMKSHAYMRFLSHELCPYLDQYYPTYQIGSTRGLIGDSLGATISLQTALAYPHTFGKVILQSPFVNDELLSTVRAFKSSDLLEIYHVVGNQETAVKTTDGKIKNFIVPNRELAQTFAEYNYSIFYDEFTGDHTWTYWQPDIKRALQLMFGYTEN